MGSHSCGTLLSLFPIGSELQMLEIGLYGTLVGQASWKFLLVLCQHKGAIESNSHYIKFICPTRML